MAAEDTNKTKVQLIAELEKLRQNLSAYNKNSQHYSQSNFRELEEQYRQVVDHSLEAIYIVQDNRIMFCNLRFAEMFGFKGPLQAFGFDIRGLISPDSLKRVEDEIRARVQGAKEISHYHFFARRLDGRQFEVETLGSRINFRGKPAIQGVMRDISKQRELEEQLRRAQKMEAIGTLAGGIAHDFNNILSIIMGYTDISLASLDDKDRLKHNLAHVLKAAHRAQELVQQILSFSRGGDLRRSRIKVVPVIRDVLKLIRASLPSTIDIKLDIGNEEYSIFADSTQLHQVLMNLCSNAGHAMREKGGILEIQLSDLNRDLAVINELNEVQSPYMRLTVKDTGHGIAPEFKERIFDPFFTTKKVGEGTGLGLSVVHGIVAGLDGEISVESTPGQGAAFHVFIPLMQTVEEETSPQESYDMIYGSGQLILFVDDEASLRDIAKEMLEQLGYVVREFGSSHDALNAFRQSSADYDLVITDLTMPKMTGIELTVEFHTIRPDIPVILCTGFTRELNTAELSDLGIDALLQKPFSRDQLAEVVGKVLQRVK